MVQYQEMFELAKLQERAFKIIYDEKPRHPNEYKAFIAEALEFASNQYQLHRAEKDLLHEVLDKVPLNTLTDND